MIVNDFFTIIPGQTSHKKDPLDLSTFDYTSVICYVFPKIDDFKKFNAIFGVEADHNLDFPPARTQKKS